MNGKYNIAIAGNQWITEYLIEKLVGGNFKPSLLINIRPDKSSNISGYVDLQEIADKYDIEIYRPDKYSLKSEIDEKVLKSHRIDALLVFGWQRLIPEWLINHVKTGVYGVHGGPERPPRARGRAVFNWAIFLGYEKFYMYMFKITPEVDSGGIIEMTDFEILPEDDISSVYHKNCIVSARMFIRNLPEILNGNARAIPQENEENATYLPKRDPENGGIFWDWPAKRITNLVRAIAPPYPCAFTFLDDKKIEIRKAFVFDKKIRFSAGPGTILDRFPNGDFIVMSADYPVYVRDFFCEEEVEITPGKQFKLHSGNHPPDPRI